MKRLKKLEDYYGFWVGKTSSVKKTILFVYGWEQRKFPTTWEDYKELQDGLNFIMVEGNDVSLGWFRVQTMLNHFRKL